MVGLGNPGERYRNTRHNVGFMILDAVAENLAVGFSREKFGGLFAEARWEGSKVLLLKPLTFMNNSGQAVAQAARNNAPDLSDLLVIVDDVNLPLGRIRLRKGGSAGGHNGLRSIIERAGTSDFPRLRAGIGREEEAGDLTRHVLSRFHPDEAGPVREMILRASDAVMVFIREGMDAAMNQFNRDLP